MTLKLRDIWNGKEITVHNVTSAFVSVDGYNWTIYTKTPNGVEDFNTYKMFELIEIY